MTQSTIDSEVKYEFGDDPTHYLEHAFRHLEVLCGEYNHDEITNQQFHSYRGQLKAQLEHKIAQEANKARLIKPGEIIPYTTIKGKDYVELKWLTDRLEAIYQVSDLVSTNSKPPKTHTKSAQSDPKRKANT